MLLRRQNLLGYRHYADDVVEAFVAKAAENGIDVFRVFDALNDVRNLETAMRAVKKQASTRKVRFLTPQALCILLAKFVADGQTNGSHGADSFALKTWRAAHAHTPPRFS